MQHATFKNCARQAKLIHGYLPYRGISKQSPEDINQNTKMFCFPVLLRYVMSGYLSCSLYVIS